MTKPGDRVFAISHADDQEVHLFGRGVYEGDFETEVVLLGTIMEGHRNPRIKLDDGRTVWGYQCWWGPESQYDKVVGSRKVTIAELPDMEAMKAEIRRQTDEEVEE